MPLSESRILYITIGGTALIAGIITFSLWSAADSENRTFSSSITKLQSGRDSGEDVSTDIGPKDTETFLTLKDPSDNDGYGDWRGGKKRRKTKRSKKASKKRRK